MDPAKYMYDDDDANIGVNSCLNVLSLKNYFDKSRSRQTRLLTVLRLESETIKTNPVCEVVLVLLNELFEYFNI